MLASIGFEIETQSFSPMQENQPYVLSNPDFFYKISLNPKTYVYPDEFTNKTLFARQHVEPFLQRKGTDLKQVSFPTQDGSSFVIKTPLYTAFHNAEFVVTFKEWQKVNDIVVFMYKSFREALQEVEMVLADFTSLGKINDSSFPYDYVWRHKHKPVIFLSKQDEWESAHFSTQCTFGIPLIYAIQVFLRLSQEFAMVTGLTSYHEQLTELSQTIETFFGRQDAVIKNYLFLFLYSYRTRGKRKTGVLFNVRHLFRNIWKYCFPKEKRDELYEQLQRSGIDPKFVAYFQQIHVSSRALESPQADQDMEKVGILPFQTKSQMFFFEFRGFTLITKYKCRQDQKWQRLTLPRLKQIRYE